MKIRILMFVLCSFFSAKSFANICGTDYQSFNPTTNGLDFVSVHSSETLKPCIYNFGAFTNVSNNTLVYNKDFTDSNSQTYKLGNKPNDQLIGLDLSLGLGLKENWDIGINLPFVLDQEIENENLNSNYKSLGLTEIKLNSKYKILGNETQGLAAIFSLNQNLIKNNPFTGTDSKPTFNFELAADKSYLKWALALNIGYRWRNPGDEVPNVPFKTLGDQFIYSTAASYYSESLATKFILEVFGSNFVKNQTDNTNKDLNSLEWLIGAKYDYENNISIHYGGGTQIANSLGSPDSSA